MGQLFGESIVTEEHKHSAPANPYLEKRRNGEDTENLERRVAEIESLLIEKGIVTKASLDRMVEIYEKDLGPMNGATVVAKAWTDAAYKKRLLVDATAAIGELGYSGLQGEHMVVVENTEKVHNVVVCTLCSCYPWPVLGLPPSWYKDAPYRSRIVIEPRKVLEEFGTILPDDVDVRVWDSSAEIRYMVLPRRPLNSDKLSQDKLRDLVTRDSMIGVKLANSINE